MNAPTNLWLSLTPEQRTATIRRAFRSKHTRARIARDLGTAYTTVTGWCERYGITIPPTAPPANAKAPWLHLPADERRRVLVEMLTSGRYISGNAIAVTLGCSKDALRKYALKQGLELPNGRGFNLPAAVAARGGPPMPVSAQGNVPVRKAKLTVAPVATRDLPASYSTAPRRPAPDTLTRVHVLDHKSTQCRFPLWPDAGKTPFEQMYYCGAPCEDPKTSYCAECRRLIRRGTATIEDRETLLAHMHLMRRVRDRSKRS